MGLEWYNDDDSSSGKEAAILIDVKDVLIFSEVFYNEESNKWIRTVYSGCKSIVLSYDGFKTKDEAKLSAEEWLKDFKEKINETT